jgi:hypothetical protein
MKGEDMDTDTTMEMPKYKCHKEVHALKIGLEQALRKWDNEVSRETTRQIERGVPPFEAAEQAVKVISTRRAAAAREREHDPA